MTRRILLCALFLASVANGQMLTGRFTTSFYGWQGRDSALAKQNYMRGYENVQLGLANANFAVNTNFQVSNDFGSVINTDPELKLSQLTFKASNIAHVGEVSLGRQFVFAGVGVGLIDGGLARVALWDRRISVTAYGGYNVVQSREIRLSKSFSENSLYGAQITVAPIENGTVGISYMNRTRQIAPYMTTRADSLFNPMIVVITHTPQEERFTSLDARFVVMENAEVSGRVDYDMDFERISRAQGFIRVELLPSLAVSGEYLFREPRIAYNSIFSVFNANSTKEIEGGVEYEFAPSLRTYARYAYVDYTDENSQRLSVGGQFEFVNIAYTQNFGYAGELNGISVQAAYPVMEQKLIPSLGVGYAGYKLDKDGPSNNVLSSSIGATYRPMPALSADLQFQYMSHEFYKSDARIFLKLTYWLNRQLGLF
jgi:Gram-negative porin